MDGKTKAIVAHITWIGWLIALIINSNQRDEIASYYIRQLLGIYLFGIVISFVPVINLFGWIDNVEVLNHYKKNPVDLFISVSASEGRPVSMQEAQSCGIPILATAVGGVPEIVSKEVGMLLSQNPTPMEIVEGILFFINNPDKDLTMREESVENWKLNFNAEINFENFAKELKMLSEKI